VLNRFRGTDQSCLFGADCRSARLDSVSRRLRRLIGDTRRNQYLVAAKEKRRASPAPPASGSRQSPGRKQQRRRPRQCAHGPNVAIGPVCGDQAADQKAHRSGRGQKRIDKRPETSRYPSETAIVWRSINYDPYVVNLDSHVFGVLARNVQSIRKRPQAFCPSRSPDQRRGKRNKCISRIRLRDCNVVFLQITWSESETRAPFGVEKVIWPAHSSHFTKSLSENRRGLSRFCGVLGAKWGCPLLRNDSRIGAKAG